jgi:zinc transporter 1
MSGICPNRKYQASITASSLQGRRLNIYFFRVILASLHVCVPLGTTLEQWEQTERYLQHCFEEYGITHVTISPEIQRDFQTLTQSAEDMQGGCRLPSHDDFGCAVSDLKKRKMKVSDAA